MDEITEPLNFVVENLMMYGNNLRVIYVLKGIFAAAESNFSFEKLFKWFYPKYFHHLIAVGKVLPGFDGNSN